MGSKRQRCARQCSTQSVTARRSRMYEFVETKKRLARKKSTWAVSKPRECGGCGVAEPNTWRGHERGGIRVALRQPPKQRKKNRKRMGWNEAQPTAVKLAGLRTGRFHSVEVDELGGRCPSCTGSELRSGRRVKPDKRRLAEGREPQPYESDK